MADLKPSSNLSQFKSVDVKTLRKGPAFDDPAVPAASVDDSQFNRMQMSPKSFAHRSFRRFHLFPLLTSASDEIFRFFHNLNPIL
jgi:hypothetical protein